MKYTMYICKFNYSGSEIYVESRDGIADFKDGFWINANYEFTKVSDAQIWIPPSKISYIYKETRVDL